MISDNTMLQPIHQQQKTPMKVMFLDIEGVLATHRVQLAKLERGPLKDFDPITVNFLNSICTKELCYIVITSRQRILTPQLDWFRSKMIHAGGGELSDFLFPDNDLWRTTTQTMDCKALEIDDWFVEFEKKYGSRFSIDKYVIVDDHTIGSISVHDRHFVYVGDGYNGMGCAEYHKVFNILSDED